MGRRLLAIAGCLAALLVIALPAEANNKPTTGAQLGLGPLAPTTFAADTPFYIEAGFVCDLGDGNCFSEEINANAGFDLYLDGVLQQSTVDVDRIGGFLGRLYLTNYPSGLPAGTYTFVGVNTQA